MAVCKCPYPRTEQKKIGSSVGWDGILACHVGYLNPCWGPTGKRQKIIISEVCFCLRAWGSFFFRVLDSLSGSKFGWKFCQKVLQKKMKLTESQQMSSSVVSSSTRVQSFVRKAGTAEELASITGCDSNIPEDITEPCCCKKTRENLSRKQKCQPFAEKHVCSSAHAQRLTTEGTCYTKIISRQKTQGCGCSVTRSSKLIKR